jgi:drug/metabolite transporter (DMT)-like permease
VQGLTPATFGLIWVTLILLSCGQVLIKLGLGTQGIPTGANPARTVLNIIAAVFRPKVLTGFSFYVVGTLVWLFVLSRVSLSIAFPLFSMSYFLVVILSATVLKERVIWKYAIVGLVLISIGVSFIGLSSPPKPSAHGVAHRTPNIEHRTSNIDHRL